MFETKEECQKYIVEKYGEDYLKFEIVVAQKVGGNRSQNVKNQRRLVAFK